MAGLAAPFQQALAGVKEQAFALGLATDHLYRLHHEVGFGGRRKPIPQCRQVQWANEEEGTLALADVDRRNQAVGHQHIREDADPPQALLRCCGITNEAVVNSR